MEKTTFLDRATPPHLFTLVAASSLASLAINIFLPSLPGIAAHFQADYALVQLAVSGYLACTGALQLVIGPLSDRYGRRPVMLVSLAVFLAASVLAVFAPDIRFFLAARMLQSSVVASLVLSRAIVRDMVDADRAASMIGYVTMGMSVVPMIGPGIGGILEGIYGWQASFLLLSAFGTVVFALIFLDLGETNKRRSSSMLAQFAAYPELIRSRRFWGYTLTATFASGAFFSFLGGGPWVATHVYGMDPAALGLYFFFIAFGYLLGNFVSGRKAMHVGVNRMMLYGSLVGTAGMALGVALVAAKIGHPMALFGPIFFVGLGNGMTLPSANAGIVSVRPHLAGSASGLGGAVTIGGGAALSAIVGALLSPATGAWPLALVMFASSGLSILSSLHVAHVARSLGAAETDARRRGAP